MLEDGEFTYDLMKIGGDAVCGIYLKGEESRSRNLPPYWLSYVSVEDVNATAERVRDLGGNVIEDPYGDETSELATITDPTGAMFVALKPKSFIGASRVNDPGCFNLNQLNTTDPERATEFYEGLFGWEISTQSQEPPYWGIHNKSSLNGGMMPSPDGNPYWLVYFTIEDLNDAVIKIDKLGGKTILPQTDVPPDGRIAVFTDPQGAIFALFEGRTDE